MSSCSGSLPAGSGYVFFGHTSGVDRGFATFTLTVDISARTIICSNANSVGGSISIFSGNATDAADCDDIISAFTVSNALANGGSVTVTPLFDSLCPSACPSSCASCSGSFTYTFHSTLIDSFFGAGGVTYTFTQSGTSCVWNSSPAGSGVNPDIPATKISCVNGRWRMVINYFTGSRAPNDYITVIWEADVIPGEDCPPGAADWELMPSWFGSGVADATVT
jgi:hypothetical protein